jgi:hypothetical protein
MARRFPEARFKAKTVADSRPPTSTTDPANISARRGQCPRRARECRLRSLLEYLGCTIPTGVIFPLGVLAAHLQACTV